MKRETRQIILALKLELVIDEITVDDKCFCGWTCGMSKKIKNQNFCTSYSR